jgi:hypothetical protein
MPRIEFIDVAPAEVSAGAEAFVRRETGTIYLITSSPVFREARSRDSCTPSFAIRKLASILAHEEWHVRNGADEKGAYHHQLITLIQLGLPPGSGVYHAVQTSMLRVLDAKKRQQKQKPEPPERLLAHR